MAKKKRLVPFKLMPASWGLSGKSRQVAEAEYYYDGDDLEYQLIKINSKDDTDFENKKLEFDLEQNNIDDATYNKKKADINNTPWVDVKNVDINSEDPKQGFMELDWNDAFVKMLQSNGYAGKSDEDVVNKWFNDICRTVLLQEAADMDFGLEDQIKADVIRINDTDNSRD